jgi:hypothetical protein
MQTQAKDPCHYARDFVRAEHEVIAVRGRVTRQAGGKEGRRRASRAYAEYGTWREGARPDAG